MSNSLDRGLDVLELLADRGELRLGDLVREIKTSRATAFRALATLQSRGYVEHVRAERIYRLGPALRGLASRSNVSSVVTFATPHMEHLRATTSETTNLAIVQRHRIVYGAILEGTHSLRMSATIGEEVPPHAAALGKAVLASLPLPQTRAFLGAEPYVACTARTITKRVDLEKELAATAVRGYALDNEEVELGAACVAAVIRGSDGQPVGAMSVSGLAARMTEAIRSELGHELRRRCDDISAQFGYVPTPDNPPQGEGPTAARRQVSARRRRPVG